jgi:hypothetical protein
MMKDEVDIKRLGLIDGERYWVKLPPYEPVIMDIIRYNGNGNFLLIFDGYEEEELPLYDIVKHWEKDGHNCSFTHIVR